MPRRRPTLSVPRHCFALACATALALAGCARVGYGPAPPPPRQLVTTPDSQTSLSVFWLGGGGITAAYQLAWTEGTTAPAHCNSDNVVADLALGVDSYEITGLQPWTDYSVRLCAIGPGNVQSTQALTATQRTLPACDQTVAADETFVAFQARIDAKLDGNGDGRRTICIADGVEVATHSAAEGSTLTLGSGADFTTICARRGDNARIVNYRTDSTGFATMSGLRVWQATEAQLANLWLEAFGTDGACFDGQRSNGSVGYIEVSNIDCTVHGASANAIDFTSRPSGAIKDIRIRLDGPTGAALVINGAGQTVADFARFSIDLQTGCSNAGCGFELSNGADFERIRWGTFTGALGNGYVFDLSDSHVGALEDVTFAYDRPGVRIDSSSVGAIRRLQATSGSGRVMWLRNGATVGSLSDSTLTVTAAASGGISLATGSSIGAMRDVNLRKAAGADPVSAAALVIADDAWVVSEKVERVSICSEAGAAQTWEQHNVSPANGLLEGSGSVTPTTHVSFVADSVLGAQTFPFDLLDGSGPQTGAVTTQEIVLGGACP